MRDDNVFWATITAILVTGVVIFALGLSYLDNLNKKQMTEKGYEQVTVPGRSDFAWQKIKGAI